MKKIFFSQVDPRWNYLHRYHKSSADDLQILDEKIIGCLNNPKNMRKKNQAWNAFGQFTKGVADLIESGMKDNKGDTSGYSIHDYGCWDCTIAMIIGHFEKKIYCYDTDKSSGYSICKVTPETLVKSLRSWQILSPIGFYFDIFNDPMSIITNRKIQLFLHEDYGARGVDVKDAVVLLHALNLKDSVGIAMCVLGHPFFGTKEDTHWVFVDPESSPENIMIFDPSEPPPEDGSDMESSTQFEVKYKKKRRVYEVCVYSTEDNIANMIGSLTL